jgi:signal transduction histidine kinase
MFRNVDGGLAVSSLASPRFPVLSSNLIRYRLPRGIVVLLLAAITIVVGTGYLYLRAALLDAAGKRAQTASLRLAASLTESARQLRLDETRITSDTTIRRTLTGAAGGASHVAAERLLAPRIARSVVALEVLDAAHHEVISLGRWPSGIAIPTDLPASTADSASDLRVGPFQAEGDSIYYATTFPIRVDSVSVGLLTELRLISGPGSAKVFADLVGSDAALFIGDRTGRVWTNLEGRVAGPRLAAGDSGIAQYRSADGTDRIGAAAPVSRTPWIAWVEFPSRSMLAPAHRFLMTIGTIALLVLIAGGIGGWFFSHRIAVPLEEVSFAAEGIAQGDLSRRVVSRGTDELGRLAQSFNLMAAQVEEAHHGLEHRVAERTTELETALRELGAAHDELVRKERLATLGQLAGSVGHELRNPLGVMTNSLYLLSMFMPQEPPLLREYLGIMKSQVTLSEKIVGDLLDFARVKQPILETFPLLAIVEEQLARAGSHANVNVVCENGAGLPHAIGDRTQVGQIVLNLLTNAVQALGENQGSVAVRFNVDGFERLRLDVTDTGCGIPPDNLERVFDPLFTTKARGIGLGLSVSRQLARVNGGDIVVTSELGVGSTFSLWLPAARAAA